MSGEKSRFTSDRRSPSDSSWADETDWVVGTTENVDVANGLLVGRVPDQSRQIPDGGELYNEGANEDSWVEGGTEGNPGSPLGGELIKEADHLFADPVPNPDGTNGVSWVYSSKIDFSNYSEIVVESASQENEAIIQIVLSPESYLDISNGEYYIINWGDGSFARKTDTFDVSGISTDYYLHLTVRDNAAFEERSVEGEFYYVGLNA